MNAISKSRMLSLGVTAWAGLLIWLVIYNASLGGARTGAAVFLGAFAAVSLGQAIALWRLDE